MTRSLIILVGIPGSGKSLAAASAAGDGIPVVSSDAVRAELLGDEADQGQADVVWAEVHRRLAGHLTRGSVLLDATNLDPAYRAPLLELARVAGARPAAWRLTTWHRHSLRANRRRARVVPPEVMGRMIGLYNTHCTWAALTAEGWTVHDVRNQPGRVDDTGTRLLFGEPAR